jgi:hypothetical protein
MAIGNPSAAPAAAPASPGAASPGVKMPGGNLPPIEGMTQAQALAHLDTLRANPLSDLARAITDAKHPEHKAVNAWQSQLYQLAYGPTDAALAASPGMTEADLKLAAVPEKPDGYEDPETHGFVAMNEPLRTEFREVAHRLGVQQGEYQDIMAVKACGAANTTPA